MGRFVKGSVEMPRDNDSPFLLDKHRRGLQNLDRMAHYREGDSVDLAVVGAGAGGLTLAQRLARRGWRVVVFEKGQTSSGGTVDLAGAGATALGAGVQGITYTDGGPVWGP